MRVEDNIMHEKELLRRMGVEMTDEEYEFGDLVIQVRETLGNSLHYSEGAGLLMKRYIERLKKTIPDKETFGYACEVVGRTTTAAHYIRQVVEGNIESPSTKIEADTVAQALSYVRAYLKELIEALKEIREAELSMEIDAIGGENDERE